MKAYHIIDDELTSVAVATAFMRDAYAVIHHDVLRFGPLTGVNEAIDVGPPNSAMKFICCILHPK